MTIHDEHVSHRHADPADIRRAVRGAAIGNTVEWFDFAIYGFLATYIADKFFPPGVAAQEPAGVAGEALGIAQRGMR